MNSICPEINTAIKMSLEAGNEIQEITEEWTKAKQVIAMKKQLDLQLRTRIENEVKKLRYWSYEGSPHDDPDEGFSCDDCKVVMSFSVARRVIR